MKANTIIYLIKEGFSNLWTSRKTAISSFVIILATMLIFGVFMLITKNLESIVKKAQAEQGIQVILLDINKEETDNIEQQIKNIYSVSSVTYISKQEALQSVIESADEKYKDLFRGFEENNPYPASFMVKLNDLEKSKTVQQELSKISNVKKINSSDETTQTIVNIGKVVNYVAIAVLAVLLATSIFIISNAIKITMFARRKEISIMKYVGATDGFIRFPFIVEGMIIGLLGAILATLVVGIVYVNLYNSAQTSVTLTTFSSALVPFSQIVQELIIIYIILGVGIGIIGSTMSIKKYLDV